MAKEKSELVMGAQQFAEEMLRNHVSPDLTYHCSGHTFDVVRAAVEIAEGCQVSREELEIVELAAWFHDLGYSEKSEGHEEVSVQMAENFLTKRNYDAAKIARVAGCIRATKMPQSPKNSLEEILCDADMIHLAFEDYFSKSELLHCEMIRVKGMEIPDEAWLKGNADFIENHAFFTEYARQAYREKKMKNLKKIKKKLKKMSAKKDKVSELEAQVEKLKLKVKAAKEITPTRGVETMFRLTSKNHLDLSSMADTKANIMISVNSIILSVLITVLFRKLEEYPHLVIPSVIMTAVCLATIVFAILATRPNISKGTFTEEDILSKRTNLLFFGNFHKMEVEKYEWGMKEMMKDADYLYTSLIRDIYFLGTVLGKKYKMLRISYTIFMFGFVVAVLAFAFAEIFLKGPSPY
jgi:predicted metal-dependent HD superfamily phosphohydrolase